MKLKNRTIPGTIAIGPSGNRTVLVLVRLGASSAGISLRGWENRSSGTSPLGPVGCPFYGHHHKGDLNWLELVNNVSGTATV